MLNSLSSVSNQARTVAAIRNDASVIVEIIMALGQRFAPGPIGCPLEGVRVYLQDISGPTTVEVV